MTKWNEYFISSKLIKNIIFHIIIQNKKKKIPHKFLISTTLFFTNIFFNNTSIFIITAKETRSELNTAKPKTKFQPGHKFNETPNRPEVSWTLPNPKPSSNQDTSSIWVSLNHIFKFRGVFNWNYNRLFLIYRF